MQSDKEEQRPQLVNAEILLGCREAAQELDIDLSSTLREFQIRAELLDSPEGFLSHYQVINFLETVAERFNCQQFGFLVGKYQPIIRLGPLVQLCRFSPTLYSALNASMLYGEIFSEIPIHELTIKGGYVDFIRRDRVPYQGSVVQLHTLGIVQIFKALKILCGENWSAHAVYFAHSAPEEQQQYRRFFGCPVAFECEFDGIVFLKSDLYKPIKTADPALLKIINAHLDQLLADKEHVSGNIAARVGHYIRQNIDTNLCDLESCAQFFNMHLRTLQRALAQHDYTFKQLVVQVRIDIAEHYLRSSDVPLTHLTEMLGYKNLSTFTRVFKNTHNIPPGQWRVRNRIEDGGIKR